MYRFTVLLSLLLLLCWSGFLVAEDRKTLTTDEELALTRDFGFLSLRMHKLSYDHRYLRTGDIDGDGLLDLAIVDNNRARIDFLIQTASGTTTKAVEDPDNINETGLEDDGFRKEHYATDTMVRDFQLVDINKDGSLDLTYLDDRGQVVIVLRDGTGWSDRNRLRAEGSQFTVTDLNGDGRVDFALLESFNLAVFLQEDEGRFAQKVSYPMTQERASSLSATDLNRDGLLDLVYLYFNDPRPIRFRLQRQGGFFGPETVSDRLPDCKDLLAANVDGQDGDELLLLLRERGTVKVLSHAIGSGDQMETYHIGDMLSYAFDSSSKSRANRNMVLSDINGDQLPDIIVTDPASSQVLAHYQDKLGGFRPAKAFPSLLSVQSLSMATIPQGEDIYLSLSKEEFSIGLSRREVEGSTPRLSFPKKLSVEGHPVAVVAASCLGDEQLELVYVSTNESQSEYKLYISPWPELDSEQQDISLPISLVEPPSAIQILDLNGDSLQDILVYQPSNTITVVLQGKDSSFTVLSSESGFTAGILANAKPAAVKQVDLNGDGQLELLVAYKNLIRVMRLTTENQFEVLDQFSGKDANTRFVGLHTGDLDDDGTLEIIAIDDKGKQLQILGRESDKSSLWVYAQSVSMEGLLFRDLFVQDVNQDGKSDILLLGKRKFSVMYTDASSDKLKEVQEFTTTINKEKGNYGTAVIGDINDDNAPDIFLYETTKNMVEILTWDRYGNFVHAREFKLYKTDPLHRGGRRDSGIREAKIADITGDGKNDVIVLIHDRLMIFPQE